MISAIYLNAILNKRLWLRKLINTIEWIDFVAEIPRGTKLVIKY